MIEDKTVSFVVRNRLCNSCGACFAACPTDAIEYVETTGGHIFPEINEAKCISCGRCISVCPGMGFMKTVAKKIPEDPFTGEIMSAFVGRAEDDDIFENSQSGGIVTALLAHLLESDEITGAVAASLKRGVPPCGESLIIRSPQELSKAQKSKYIPIPLLKVVPTILSTEGRFALVGLPCHIHGLHNLYSLYPALEQKIAVTIGLICDRVLSMAVLDHFTGLASFLSLNYITFRDKQCPTYPGNVVVEGEDGRIKVLDSSNRIAAKDFFTPARCRICFDKLNVLADVVAGDPHGISGINRLHGESLLFVRTQKGRELLDRAVHGRVISVREIPAVDAVRGQGIEKKRQEWNAFALAWKKQGLPLPNYTDLLLSASSKISQRYKNQCDQNLQLALALDNYGSRADVVEVALSWLKKKKQRESIALPYRYFRRMAGVFLRKVKNIFKE